MSEEASLLDGFAEAKFDLYAVASSICRCTSLKRFRALLEDLNETYIPQARVFLRSRCENKPTVSPDTTTALEDLQMVCHYFMNYLVVRFNKLEDFADQLHAALDDGNDAETKSLLLSKLTRQKPRMAVLGPQEVFNNVLAGVEDRTEDEANYCAMWSVLDRIEIYIEEMWKKFYQVAENPRDLELMNLQP